MFIIYPLIATTWNGAIALRAAAENDRTAAPTCSAADESAYRRVESPSEVDFAGAARRQLSVAARPFGRRATQAHSPVMLSNNITACSLTPNLAASARRRADARVTSRARSPSRSRRPLLFVRP